PLLLLDRPPCGVAAPHEVGKGRLEGLEAVDPLFLRRGENGLGIVLLEVREPGGDCSLDHVSEPIEHTHVEPPASGMSYGRARGPLAESSALSCGKAGSGPARPGEVGVEPGV